MTRRIFIVVLLVGVLVSSFANAEAQGAKQRAIDFSTLAQQSKQQPAREPDSVLHKKDIEDEIEHRAWEREFTRKSWEWHLLSTRVVFGVVVLIVIVGLGLTIYQFQRDYTGRRRRSRGVSVLAHTGADAAGSPLPAERSAPTGDDNAGLARAATSLKIGPAGLEMTSQIVGLLILAFSLVFFYLYVKEVYPMRAIEPPQQAQDGSRKE